MDKYRQPFKLEEVGIPDVELMLPQDDPLDYIAAVKRSLRANEFVDYTPAKIEQLEKDIDEACSLGYEKYESDGAIHSFILAERIHIALQLYPLKYKINYGEYLREEYVKSMKSQFDDEPATKR